MPSSVWKGSISFGLLNIPIRLYAAARSERTYLHQIHKVCNTRIRQPLYCPTCDRIVDRKEVVRGYEYEDGQYVLITQDEIKKITPASSRIMEILAFVEESQIDPIYFDASYLALPDKDADKAYALLLKAMEDTKRVGIAKLTMHQREYTVFLRPRDHGLTLHTMYFANEIRSVEGYGDAEKEVKIKPQELKLAQQLIETLSANFKIEQYHDTFQDNLKALIDAKLKGKTIVEEHKTPRAPVIDMMEALKRSVQAKETQKRATKGRSSGKDRESHRRMAS